MATENNGVGSLNEIRLIAKRWLSDEEFREILGFARYKGYIRGVGSVFILDIKRAQRNGYSADDIVSIINSYNLEVIGDLDKLVEEMKNKEKTVVIRRDPYTSEFLVIIPWSTYSTYREELRNALRASAARIRGKSHEGLHVLFKPYFLTLFIEKIRSSSSILIRDETGVLREKPLNYNAELVGIELRSYQKEALDAWAKNNYKGIIALPTGAGKTIVAIAAIVMARRKTLIVTFTKEQMFQWREMILKYTNLPSNMIGVFYSGEKRLNKITITTYQSGFRYIDELGLYYDLLVVDECHHLPAEKFRKIALYSTAPMRLGLSATVIREDGKHTELFPLLGGIIYHRSAEELVRMGYLAPYRIELVKIKMATSEMREYIKLRDLYRKYAKGRKFAEILEAAKHGDTAAQIALKLHGKMKMLLARSKTKIEKAAEIALKELNKGNKIIIFTQYVEQAKEIAKKLNAYLLIGEMPAEKRQLILNKFKNTKSGVLVVTTIGDEGIDIPDVNIGIIVSGTGSRRQFIQRLGRLLRPKPGKQAILYEIILKDTPEEYQARKRKRKPSLSTG